MFLLIIRTICCCLFSFTSPFLVFLFSLTSAFAPISYPSASHHQIRYSFLLDKYNIFASSIMLPSAVHSPILPVPYYPLFSPGRTLIKPCHVHIVYLLSIVNAVIMDEVSRGWHVNLKRVLKSCFCKMLSTIQYALRFSVVAFKRVCFIWSDCDIFWGEIFWATASVIPLVSCVCFRRCEGIHIYIYYF